MGDITFNEEFPCAVAPQRMFEALFVDWHNLGPKIMPDAVKSIEFVSGDGEPGSIQQVNFVDGLPLTYVKNRLDLKDKENLVCKYAIVESDTFDDKIDFVANEVKFEAGPDGGCMCKIKTTCHPKGDAVLDEEKVKAGQDNYLVKYKAVINHLVENPDAYA